MIDGVESGAENYTVNNLPEMLDVLIERIESEGADFGKRSSGYEKMANAANKKRNAIKDEIRKIGQIGYKISGGAVRLFSQYQTESVNYYSNRTYERATKYGADFCSELIDSLRSLRKEVGQFKLNVVTLRENLLTDLNVEKSNKSGIEDWINWEDINDSIQQYFVTDKRQLEVNGNAIWENLKELRGDRKEFQAYNRNMVVDEKTNVVRGDFPNTIRKETLQYSHTFHSTVVENHPEFKPFFGRNILKELYEEFNEVTPALERIVQGWIKDSSPMVSFDAGQPRPSVPKPGPRKRRLLMLPACQDVPASFSEALKSYVEGMLTNSEGEIRVKTIPEDRCPNEISTMTVAFYFPLRQAAVTSALKTHYDRAMMSKDGKFTSYQCHSESSRFPDLMLPTRAEELELKLPSVLAASALGLLQLPDELDLPIYFGTRQDKYSPIENRVDSGFKLSNTQFDQVERIKEQYESEISIELAILYSNYHEHFIRESGAKVEELLEKAPLSKQVLDQSEELLSNYLKWVFLLAKRNEQDERYGKFKEAINEAINRVIPEIKEKL